MVTSSGFSLERSIINSLLPEVDIEAVIKDTIEKAFINDLKYITTDNIIAELNETKPMSISLKDKIDHLTKTLDKLDVKKASE